MHDFGLSWKELAFEACEHQLTLGPRRTVINRRVGPVQAVQQFVAELLDEVLQAKRQFRLCGICQLVGVDGFCDRRRRSEEHTSELQSLMRISYAVFCLKKKKYTK